MSGVPKNQKAYKETGTYSPFKRKNKSTNVPGKDLMADILKKT